VQGTINGMGERAGNCDLAEFALALEAVYGGQTGLAFEHIGDVARTVQRLSGYDLAPWKPVTGDNLFIRESGAVAAQFHDPPAIEPYSSALVGARRGMALGKKSGAASIKIKLDELGLEVPADRQAELLEQVKRQAVANGGRLSDDEFRLLVQQHPNDDGAH
jgi:isopropylmalate/homocitrate/citramalate synthase